MAFRRRLCFGRIDIRCNPAIQVRRLISKMSYQRLTLTRK